MHHRDVESINRGSTETTKSRQLKGLLEGW